MAIALETQAKSALSGFLANFLGDDVGTLAVDSVQYAATLVDDGAGKRDAAKTSC